MNSNIITNISNWLNSYLIYNNLKSFIVGVSGGVDSALVSTLCAMTGKPVHLLNIPIESKASNTSLSSKHCNWLKSKYSNVSVHEIDLTETYKVLQLSVTDDLPRNELACANTKSRLRMVLLYQYATSLSGLVVGTGNKIEDFGVGFFTKYGDGGVDISPIGDLTKTQVRALCRELGVLQEILDAAPTDGLWNDDRTDEGQLGASYEELERAMDYIDNNKSHQLSTREEEVVTIFLRHRVKNKHKMQQVPIFHLEAV